MSSLKKLLFFCVLLLLIATTLSAQNYQVTDTTYTFKKGTPEGTGKFYMGREIAQVMGFEGANWLERNTRQQEENTSLAIAKLPITKTSAVADIGAGTGYYTFRIARNVPQGKVYAVEIQAEALNYLKERSRQLKLDNVVVVKGGEMSANLPDSTIDVAMMVDVYHELLYPHEMLQSIRRSLKTGGKLLLLEYRAEDPKVQIKRLHEMTITQVNLELKANGFHLVQDGEFMPIQHFLVYQKD